MKTLVQTSPQVDTSESVLIVRSDDGVPEPLERDRVVKVELLPAVEGGHLVVGPGGWEGAGHADQLVEVGGGGAHHADRGVVDVVFVEDTLLGGLSPHKTQTIKGQFAPVVTGKRNEKYEKYWSQDEKYSYRHLSVH